MGLDAAMWSELYFSQDPVREDRLWWITHTATAYNLDGVDLNLNTLVRQNRPRIDSSSDRFDASSAAVHR